MLRHRFVLAVVAIVVVWLAVVTVQIARQPEIGVDSPQQLQRQLATALNARDAGALAEVVGYPVAEVDDFAKAYLARLDEVNASAITVTLLPDPRDPKAAEIRGERASTRPAAGNQGSRVTFSYRVAVGQVDGSWRVEFIPPL
ncbi:hypothetical protein BAY61_28635 [Prauserella marina]|uniref:Uncharacterized protein n=1 Tax=Prauserella marina TaxID=530584 RepID=A0A222VWN2_9PSEU|nr:hypothetical protein [Prauserella marina]ASR38315.1 hypothetical protein BAY61_28635 [Prauserella marina]PWV78475.1 hypothetical protein DES30_104210 [Prauserella marina]SDC86858.1 hypothetical protein SAMN05421630_104210 [Prauserella marina]